MNKHKVKHHRKSDTKTANRDHIRTTEALLMCTHDLCSEQNFCTHFYIAKEGVIGVCVYVYFLIFALKHRLWVRFRIAPFKYDMKTIKMCQFYYYNNSNFITKAVNIVMYFSILFCEKYSRSFNFLIRVDDRGVNTFSHTSILTT